MEGPPKNGHTIERHVGKSEEDLKNRLKTDKVSAAASSYLLQLSSLFLYHSMYLRLTLYLSSSDSSNPRLKTDKVSAASTYYDKETATKAVKDSLKQHDKEIQDWLEMNELYLIRDEPL
jgi:hypothetical protein